MKVWKKTNKTKIIISLVILVVVISAGVYAFSTGLLSGNAISEEDYSSLQQQNTALQEQVTLLETASKEVVQQIISLETENSNLKNQVKQLQNDLEDKVGN